MPTADSAISGLSDAAAAGLPGSGGGLSGSLAAQGGSNLGASPGFLSSVGSSAGPAAAGSGGLSGLMAQIPGGYGGLGAGLGGLSAPLEDQQALSALQNPPGFGGNINLNVAPIQRAYRPYTGDPAKFGQQPGGWQFFDQVNPPPQFLAGGGGVAQLRSPGAGLMGLGQLRNPGIPSQIEAPHFNDAQALRAQAQDMSPAAQRVNLRRAAMLGYVNAKDGGAISGPGGPTDDEVPAMLSNNEHVIDAATVKAAGHGSYDRGHRAVEKFKRKARAQAGMSNPKKPPAFGGA